LLGPNDPLRNDPLFNTTCNVIASMLSNKTISDNRNAYETATDNATKKIIASSTGFKGRYAFANLNVCFILFMFYLVKINSSLIRYQLFPIIISISVMRKFVIFAQK